VSLQTIKTYEDNSPVFIVFETLWRSVSSTPERRSAVQRAKVLFNFPRRQLQNHRSRKAPRQAQPQKRNRCVVRRIQRRISRENLLLMQGQVRHRKSVDVENVRPNRMTHGTSLCRATDRRRSRRTIMTVSAFHPVKNARMIPYERVHAASHLPVHWVSAGSRCARCFAQY